MTKPKIGLEIHSYVQTKEKLFCTCKRAHGKKESTPNTNICPTCTGQPGAKPMAPNKTAIDKTVQIGLLLGCKVNEKIVWQRKHYSWPDLPKGFQNTLSGPHATESAIKGKFLGKRIAEIHLEEDPAAWNPESGSIDYNRSGSPLIEIVTEPDFTSAEEVVEWLAQLTTTLAYVKALDKAAGIKADVNVSIDGGKRIEIKNVNSLQNIHDAIIAEIKRQEKSPPKEQETRRYNPHKKTTTLMRSKENAQDYRFIADPDLPTIKFDKKRIEHIKKHLPKTPIEKVDELVKTFKLDKKTATILIKDLELVDIFERVAQKITPLLATQWITGELLSVLNYNKTTLDETEIHPDHLIELLTLVEKKELTPLKAKDILRQFVPKSFSPKEEAQKHTQISDESELRAIAKEVLKENKKATEDYKKGETKALNFLIGQMMRKTNKRADFKTAKELLEKTLK